MRERIRKSAGYLCLSALLIGIDQLVKRWAYVSLRPTDGIPLIPGLIGLRYAENTGAAFSVFSGSTLLLTLFSLIVCIALVVWLVRRLEMKWTLRLPLSAVLAGGVGNLIDRAMYGYVVDMFEFQFIRFAIFNVADICITLGAIGLLAALMFGGDEHGHVEN